MKNISARDYDVFKSQFDFEQTPTGADFFISSDKNGYSWSTDGKTMGKDIGSITRTTSIIKSWAEANNKTGKVWFIDGGSRKYVGQIH